MGMDAVPVIEVLGLSAGYRRNSAVLKGVDLKVEAQQLVAVLGTSGSGKSTLLRVIAGLLRPTSGTVRVHGKAVAEVSPQLRGIGFVFQHLALFPNMSVAQNVAFGLQYTDLAQGARQRRTAELIGALRLTDVADKRPHELSGGQAQRVALARALAPEPRLLLLDEPLSSLDRPLADDARALVMRIHRERDLTTLLVTHDREQALSIADRIVVLGSDGTIQQDALPATVYEVPRTIEVAALTGPLNRLSGRAVGMSNGRLLVDTGRGEVCAKWMYDRQPEKDAPVYVAFRPEWATVDQVAEPAVSRVGQVRALVNQVVLSGPRKYVYCSVNGLEILLDGAVGMDASVDKEILVRLDPNRILAYPRK